MHKTQYNTETTKYRERPGHKATTPLSIGVFRDKKNSECLQNVAKRLMKFHRGIDSAKRDRYR